MNCYLLGTYFSQRSGNNCPYDHLRDSFSSTSDGRRPGVSDDRAGLHLDCADVEPDSNGSGDRSSPTDAVSHCCACHGHAHAEPDCDAVKLAASSHSITFAGHTGALGFSQRDAPGVHVCGRGVQPNR
jgi:hypothetical protein